MNAPEFQMDEGWLVYDPAPSRPAYRPPPGAVDAHCHVFGPGARFPFAPERKYTPCDAPKEALWKLREHLGFSRSVIVQATCHGADNRALVDALNDAGDTARGVATVRASVTDDELAALDRAGVRGVRFNFVSRLVDKPPVADLKAIAGRIADLGWHVVLYFEAQDLDAYFDFFASLPGTVVVDHMGRPDLGGPVEGGAFDRFVELLASNADIWAKVTCPERLSSVGPPAYPDFVPFARRLVETFPDRVLWGTDWPHPNMATHMPDDGHLVDMIPRIAVSEAARRRLLVDNPARLYWPEAQRD